jgi:hypothetical protein
VSGAGRGAVFGGWGPPGNERLTTSVGLLLIVLLTVEVLTTIALNVDLPVHIFLGLLLIPPVVLKLASTGWRFLRYYTNSSAYRLVGPPRLLLRVLGPFLVASSLTLFGTGVGLIIVGHGGGVLLQIHVVSFAAWSGLMIIHVLAYARRALRVGLEDWGGLHSTIVAGRRARRVALGASLLAGLVLALATLPAQDAWLDHRQTDRHAARLEP